MRFCFVVFLTVALATGCAQRGPARARGRSRGGARHRSPAGPVRSPDPVGRGRTISRRVTARRCATWCRPPRRWTRSSRSRRGPAVRHSGSGSTASTGPGADAAREYYRIMYGPWDRLVGHEPFLGTRPIPTVPASTRRTSRGASSRPGSEQHPEDPESFRSLHTIIRRDGDRLVAIPYSAAYSEPLARAAESLRAAAGATDNAEPGAASSSCGPSPSPATTTSSRIWPGWTWTRPSRW